MFWFKKEGIEDYLFMLRKYKIQNINTPRHVWTVMLKKEMSIWFFLFFSDQTQR